jgi:hypothetical protein
MVSPYDPATVPNLPQPNATPSTWDPTTISNIIFSAIMVFIGIIAIWQAHQAARRRQRLPDGKIQRLGGSEYMTDLRTEENIIELLSRRSTLEANAVHTDAVNTTSIRDTEASSPDTQENRQAALATETNENSTHVALGSRT